MKAWVRRGALVLATVVHLAHSGCGSPPSWPDLPPPPSEEERASLSSLTVHVIEDDPEGPFAPPLAETCTSACYHSALGAGFGLAAGAAIMGAVGHGSRGSGDAAWIFAFLFLFALAVTVALLGAGATFGGLYGALRPNSPEVEAGIEALHQAAHDAALARLVASKLVERHDLSLGGEGDARLEIGPVAAGFFGRWAEDPPLGLAGALPARLVRDGRVVWSGEFAFRAPERPFKEWARDEGIALQDALRASADGLADRIGRELFTLYLLPQDRRIP